MKPKAPHVHFFNRNLNIIDEGYYLLGRESAAGGDLNRIAEGVVGILRRAWTKGFYIIMNHNLNN